MQLELELNSVRSQLATLATKLAKVCSDIEHLQPISVTNPEPVQGHSVGDVDTPTHPSYASVTSAKNISPVINRNYSDGNKLAASTERRFNVIVLGLDEAAKGTARAKRQEHDMESASSVLLQVDPTFDNLSVHRLGKFNHSQTKPRPLLIRLTRTSDVTKLLANCNCLKQLSIKPDLPASERAKNNALMKVRWSLLQAGTEKQKIKIRGNSLFVGGTLHAKFHEGKLNYSNQLEESPSDEAPSLVRHISSPVRAKPIHDTGHEPKQSS